MLPVVMVFDGIAFYGPRARRDSLPSLSSLRGNVTSMRSMWRNALRRSDP
jgi:hypothetical protein